MKTNVLKQFQQTRERTEQLCSPLAIEDYIVQTADFASPPKWHLAHTTWFFEEFILKVFYPGYISHNKDYGFLFNSYYNNAGERTLRAERGCITRPGVEEIYTYRRVITKAVEELLLNNPEQDILQLVVLGIHHEMQHQELLITDLKYNFSQNPTLPIYSKSFDLTSAENSTEGFIRISEGLYNIGFQDDGFCYDNELGVHKIYLHEAEIANRLITNEEYIEFIESGAYSDFNLWLDDGWSWLRKNNIKAPLYWHKIDDEFHQYTLAGLQKLQPQAQVCHISYYEAAAFAEWQGMRLPTEFEWEVAGDSLCWGSRWEWTNSAYLPYPNFIKKNGAVGEYNGKFMINQMVLRGASAATAQYHSRKTYRNFFYPHERWQFTGIRLAAK